MNIGTKMKRLNLKKKIAVGSVMVLAIITLAVFLYFQLKVTSDSVAADTIPIEQTMLYGLSIYAVFSSVAVIALAALTFYLYWWRKVLLSHPETLVPEKWAEVLMRMAKAVEAVNQDSVKTAKDTNSIQIKVYEKSEQTLEAFMSLHKVMDEKDREINRLKKGYDTQIYAKFLKRFIRADVAAREMMEECPDNAELHMVRRLVEDALLECDVEVYEPQVGKDYRHAVGVADSPSIEETQDTEKDFQIAEVIEPGYHICGAEEPIVLREAKVKIYRIKKVTK